MHQRPAIIDRRGRLGDFEGDTVRDPDEQAVIRRIVRLHDEGLGLREIARELDAASIPCRAGTWYHTTVKGILDRARAP
jgi:IS30 family transposase